MSITTPKGGDNQVMSNDRSMTRTHIYEAIESLCMRKCRPEREIIAHYVLKKYGTDFQEVFNELELIVDEGDLVKVEYKDRVSYRDPKTFDNKSYPLLTKHSKILNSTKTSRFITTAVSELLGEKPEFSREGIPIQEIETKLISYDNLRFTSSNSGEFVTREVSSRSIKLAPNGRIFPKDLPIPAEIRNMGPKKMRGRKSKVMPVEDALPPVLKREDQVFAVKSTPSKYKPSPKKISEKSTDGDDFEGDFLSSGDECGGESSSGTIPKNNSDETVSSGGRAVRNKRKKEVFDPSIIKTPKKMRQSLDVTRSYSTPQLVEIETQEPASLPHLKSKRGRKKKEEHAVAPICAECNDKKNSKGQIESSLECIKCSTTYHPSCLGLKHKTANILRWKGNWICSKCNSCTICHSTLSHDGDNLTCFTCERNFHTKCLDITLDPKSDSNLWTCSECSQVKKSKSISNSNPPPLLIEQKNSHSQNEEISNEDDDGDKIEKNDDEKCEENDEIDESLEEVDEEEIIKEDDEEEEKSEKIEKVVDFVVVDKNEKIDKIEIIEKVDKIVKNLTEIKVIVNEKKEIHEIVLEPPSSTTIDKIDTPTTTTITTKRKGRPPKSSRGLVKPEVEIEEPKKVEFDEIPDDVSKWTPSHVEAYFKKYGLREEGILFREQEIDGLSLLLLRRQDIVNGMKLLLGPALKVYRLVFELQQNSHPPPQNTT